MGSKLEKVITHLMLLCSIFWSASVLAQKKPITNETYKNWIKLLPSYGISNDGKYAWYAKTNGANISQFWLADLISNKQVQFGSNLQKSPEFTLDKHNLIYKVSGDSLCIRNLKTQTVRYLIGVETFTSFSYRGKESIAYLSKGTLIIYDVATRQSHSFPDVQDFKINKQGTGILVMGSIQVSLISLPGYQMHNVSMVSTSPALWDFVFDNSGDGIAFISKLGDKLSVRYYHQRMNKSVLKVTNTTEGMPAGSVVSNQQLEFTSDDKTLIFRIIKPLPLEPDSDLVSKEVDIWSYRDNNLQSFQINSERNHESQKYAMAISLSAEPRVVELENDQRKLVSYTNKYALVKSRLNESDSYFTPNWTIYSELIKLESGKVIKDKLFKDAFFSPTGKFLVWIDQKNQNIFSYVIEKNEIRNLTESIREVIVSPLSTEFWDYPFWGDNDTFFLIARQNDIWQLNPMGHTSPINLTNEYGKTHHIQFRLSNNMIGTAVGVSSNKKIILTGTNTDTYESGFWTKILGVSGDPVKQSMDPCFYDNLLKARDTDRYLVARQTANKAPNLYVSNDLVSFKALSNVQPQNDYNWLSAELISYILPDGATNKAILYKPDNFDPSKKYPVIFHYYQHMSNTLYHFPEPGLATAVINIPYYVSNGYLVCVVDIINKPGKIATVAVNSVEYAAKYLIGKYSWINEKKMGLQGHSFGGYETNLLVANSTMFAAAQSSSGMSDVISMFGDLGSLDKSLNAWVEVGQPNLQGLPWNDLELYTKSSPVLQADKIRTPLLLMHCKQDPLAPWKQGVELFSALRRLQKPCWMLQYDRGGHLLFNDEDALDFTIRQKQFFDHYLMDKPAPIWMTQGVPASYKGIRSGLALDSTHKAL